MSKGTEFVEKHHINQETFLLKLFWGKTQKKNLFSECIKADVLHVLSLIY